jgi:hypothetical protein
VRHDSVLLVAGLLSMSACAGASPTAPERAFTGDWGLSVAAAPSCIASLPFGYGVAPRGGGTASLVQSGNRLSGTLSIFGTPSGTLEGTIDGDVVNFSINLSGRNVGVGSPADERCHVVGTATGFTYGSSCGMAVKISGEFACPYSCTAVDHILVFDRGRTCR